MIHCLARSSRTRYLGSECKRPRRWSVPFGFTSWLSAFENYHHHCHHFYPGISHSLKAGFRVANLASRICDILLVFGQWDCFWVTCWCVSHSLRSSLGVSRRGLRYIGLYSAGAYLDRVSSCACGVSCLLGYVFYGLCFSLGVLFISFLSRYLRGWFPGPVPGWVVKGRQRKARHVFGLGIFTSLYSYLFFCFIYLRFNAPFVVLPPGSAERRWESKAWYSSERAFWMGEYLAPLGYCTFAVLYLFYCSLCLDTTSEIPIIIYLRPIRGCRQMTNYAGHITSDGCRGDARSWP